RNDQQEYEKKRSQAGPGNARAVLAKLSLRLAVWTDEGIRKLCRNAVVRFTAGAEFIICSFRISPSEAAGRGCGSPPANSAPDVYPSGREPVKVYPASPRAVGSSAFAAWARSPRL